MCMHVCMLECILCIVCRYVHVYLYVSAHIRPCLVPDTDGDDSEDHHKAKYRV